MYRMILVLENCNDVELYSAVEKIYFPVGIRRALEAVSLGLARFLAVQMRRKCSETQRLRNLKSGKLIYMPYVPRLNRIYVPNSFAC